MLLPAPAIVVSANARFLTKMGRVYIYSKQRISKGIFDDDEFRAMCQAFYEAGGGKDTAPCLRRHSLLKYVKAEFECFRKLCKILGQGMLENSEGNPFCQEMDDGATLANHHKFLAVGVQLFDPLLQRNHAMCLGMRRLKGDTHEQNAEAIGFCTQRAFGMSTKQIAHSRRRATDQARPTINVTRHAHNTTHLLS